ncbi:MAG: methyltransferase domain-containing protein [Acidimicrobiales bacterium]
MDAVTALQIRQSKLFALMVCPRCRAGLAWRDAVEAFGVTIEADLWCRRCAKRVGVVTNFRASFLDREMDKRPPGPRQAFMPVATPWSDVELTGHWQECPEGYIGQYEAWSSVARSRATCAGFVVKMVGHPWSGITLIDIDGATKVEVDCYRGANEVFEIEIEGLDFGAHDVEVRPSGRRNDSSLGTQVVLCEIAAYCEPQEGHVAEFAPLNRGNEYSHQLHSLLNGLGADGLLLDNGGGDRRLGDERVINLEYLPYELPDLLADGLNLPFADDTFDAVFSQAVLEHVPDPQRAVDEMHRVLRPGGEIFIEAAYMQPLHAVPSHYFNVTPFGLDYLCRNFDKVESDWSAGPYFTLEWLGRLVSADALVGADRWAQMLATLHDFDNALSHEQRRFCAGAVSFLGKKS